MGVIAIWSGATGDIPAGWVICDGNNGSPDLQDKFVIGAGSTYAVADNGGDSTHTHTGELDDHNHTFGAGTTYYSGYDYDTVTAMKGDTFTSNASLALPPYYALAFIYNASTPTEIADDCILIWSGAVGDIPAGWNLCDGDNGTVNLEDKFIIGAGSTYAVGDNSATSHVHTGTSDGHGHNMSKGNGFYQDTGGNNATNDSTVTFTTNAADNLPPYYALAYIQNTSGGNKTIEEDMVAIWSGAIVDIPSGWQLCNGVDGAPDLRDNFVIGAGNTYAVDATGGNANHSHSGTSNGHTHSIGKGKFLDYGSGRSSVSSANTASLINVSSQANLPPYYALAYIVKLAVTGTNTQINISDSWKSIAAMQINIGDVWKDVAGAQINIGDAWKTIF